MEVGRSLGKVGEGFSRLEYFSESQSKEKSWESLRETLGAPDGDKRQHNIRIPP